MAQDGRFFGGGQEREPDAELRTLPRPSDGSIDLSLPASLQAVESTPTYPESPPSVMDEEDRGFWRTLGGEALDVMQAANRGLTVGIWNGITNNVAEASAAFQNATARFIPEPVADFLGWHSGVTAVNRAEIPQEWIDKNMGKADSWYEDMTEMGASIAGTYALGVGAVSALGGAQAAATVAGTPARRALAGGVADMAVLEAQEAKLADLLKDSPFEGDYLRWLANEEDDTFLESKFKQMVEGTMLGGVAEVAISGLMRTASRLKARYLREAGDTLAADAAEKQAAQYHQMAQEAADRAELGTGKYLVEETPDGGGAVVIREEKPPIDIRGIPPSHKNEIAHITRNTRPGEGEFRVTYFDTESGTPRLLPGHAHHETLEEAIQEVRNAGFLVPEESIPKGIDGGGGPKRTPTPEGRAVEFDDGTTFKVRSVEGDETTTEAFQGTFQTDDGPFTLSGEVDAEGVVHVNTFGAGDSPDQAFISLVLRGDAPGVGQVGVRRLRELGDQIGEVFPEAKRIEGIRTGSTGGREGREISFPIRRVANERRITTATTEEAQQLAATFELVEEAVRHGPEWDETQLAEWRKLQTATEEAMRTGDVRVIERAQAASNINLRYIHNHIESKSAISALAETIDMGRDVIPHGVTRKLARSVFPDMDPDDAIVAAQRFFDSTEQIGAKLVALRGYLTGYAKEATRLSKLVGTTTGKAKQANLDRLTQVMEKMLELQYNVSGAAGNVARGLESQKIRVGAKKMPPEVRAVADAADGVDAANNVLKQAKEAGDEEAVKAAQKQLEEIMDTARRLIDEEATSAIEGARVGDEVSAGQMPAREPGEPQVQTADLALDPELEADRLASALREAVDEAEGRMAKVREQEGLQSPFAPTDRVSVMNMTPEEIEALAYMVSRADGDHARVLAHILTPAAEHVARTQSRFLHAPDLSGWKKAFRAIHWYRLQAMLSGGTTHVVNQVTTGMATIQRPIERAMGAISKEGIDREAIHESVDMAIAMWRYMGDAARMAKEGFLRGETVLKPQANHVSHSMGDLRELWRKGTIGGYAEAFAGTPTRALIGGDEFWTQLNYRGHLYAGLRRDARRLVREGSLEAGEAMEEWIERRMRMGFNDAGEGTMQDAVDYALETTFKADLGKYGSAFEDLVGTHEWLQVIVPFRRTPINLAKYAWRRFPGLNRLNSEYRAALSGELGLRAQQQAKGEMRMGTMFYTAGAWLAYNGFLTGSGPDDMSEQQAWRSANRKYELRIPGTEKAVQIGRADPVFTPLTLIADLMEMAGEHDVETVTEAATAIVATIAKSASDRALMRELSDFLAAVTTGDTQQLGRWFKDFGGSFVPRAVSTTTGDEYYRDARGMLDELASRTWWLADDVEPMRNYLGEPVKRPAGAFQRAVNPFTLRDGFTEDEEQMRELYRVGLQVSTPEPIKRYGRGENAIEIDLRDGSKYSERGGQSPYDRWMERMSTSRVGGRTLRERLARAMETDQWNDPDTSEEFKANWAETLREVHLQTAWVQTLQEYPSLQNHVRFARTQAKFLETGMDEDRLEENRERFGEDERSMMDRFRNVTGLDQLTRRQAGE